jgi:endonuclease/exonuclease/phosphatase (EEP) superfamily protein YafD
MRAFVEYSILKDRRSFARMISMKVRPHVLLRACVLMLAIATILGDLGRFDWRFDLLAHWRLQYALTAGILMPWLLLRRYYRYAAGAVLIICVNSNVLLQPIAAMPAAAGIPVQPPHRLRLANVNVLYSNTAYQDVLGWVNSVNPDLAVLVEFTKAWDPPMAPIGEYLPYSVKIPGRIGEGLALYSRYKLNRSTVVHLGQARRAAIIAGITIAGCEVTVVAAHPVPPRTGSKTRDRDRYLAELARLIGAIDGPVIVAGDLNTTPWSYAFAGFVRSARLTEGEFTPTWPSLLGPLGIPIDHVLGKGIAIETLHTGPRVGSDHLPLFAEVSIGKG